jgi:hypothetical protein
MVGQYRESSGAIIADGENRRAIKTGFVQHNVIFSQLSPKS